MRETGHTSFLSRVFGCFGGSDIVKPLPPKFLDSHISEASHLQSELLNPSGGARTNQLFVEVRQDWGHSALVNGGGSFYKPSMPMTQPLPHPGNCMTPRAQLHPSPSLPVGRLDYPEGRHPMNAPPPCIFQPTDQSSTSLTCPIGTESSKPLLTVASDPQTASGACGISGYTTFTSIPGDAPIHRVELGESTEALSLVAQLEQDLDTMHAKGIALLDRFDLLAPSERRSGGQGVVQFATGRLDSHEYAIKFFLDRRSFDQERSVYIDPTLQKLIPAVADVVSNDAGTAMGPSGRSLPPFIVVERGESLNEWAIRSAPDFVQSLAVLMHVAQRLIELHKLNLVHRDLKPANVLWQIRCNSWTLIDFGSVARAGEYAPVSYSPHYVAPEVIQAIEEGRCNMRVTTSIDMWSFGVLAFELLTKSRAFPLGTTIEQHNDQILGRAPEGLPWEYRMSQEHRHRLMILKPTVLAMLQRDPSKRPDIFTIVRQWTDLFTSASVTAGPSLDASDPYCTGSTLL